MLSNEVSKLTRTYFSSQVYMAIHIKSSQRLLLAAVCTCRQCTRVEYTRPYLGQRPSITVQYVICTRLDIMALHKMTDKTLGGGLRMRLIQLCWVYQTIPRSTAIQSSQSLPSTTTFLLVVSRTPLNCENWPQTLSVHTKMNGTRPPQMWRVWFRY